MKLIEKLSFGTPFDIFATIIFFALVFIWYFELSPSFILGSIITLTGIVIWTWARINIRKSFSILPKAKKLVTTGIYSKIRHPVYVGCILTFLGLSIITNYLLVWISLFLIILMQTLRAKKEEETLIKKFGKRYLAYKKKTWF